MHANSGNDYKRTSGATHAPLAYCPPLLQGQLLQDAGFWPFTVLPGVVVIAARTTLLAPCRSAERLRGDDAPGAVPLRRAARSPGVYSNVEPNRKRAHTRVPCPSHGNLARHPEEGATPPICRAAGTAEWPRAWWHRGQIARKMRIAALVTSMVGVGLAPQPAAAVGAAGCGNAQACHLMPNASLCAVWSWPLCVQTIILIFCEDRRASQHTRPTPKTPIRCYSAANPRVFFYLCVGSAPCC
jgi:hypothetical protein